MKTNDFSPSGIKVLLWIPLACLAGFIAGSWGSKEELRAHQQSAKEEKGRSARKAGGFDTFANMVKIPEMTRRPRKTKRAAGIGEKTSRAAGDVAAKPPAASPAVPPNAPPRRSVEDLGVRIEEAQELWRTRVEVARAQWKENLALSDEAGRVFDGALQEMNERLYECVAAVAERLESSETMTPELGLRLVGETTAIMAETYDKVGACVPPGLRTEVSSMQMVDFVDPGVAEPLIGVQGKLEGIGRQMGRGL